MQRLEKNWLEWTVFGLSFALVAMVLGYLGYWQWIGSDSPPKIRIELGPSEKRGDRYYVPVTLYNEGQTTVEGVRVSVTQQRGDEQDEAEFEVMFLPHHSQRKGEAVFKSDPAEANELTPRVLGYRMP